MLRKYGKHVTKETALGWVLEKLIISPMNKEKCVMQKEQYILKLRVMKRSGMFREE